MARDGRLATGDKGRGTATTVSSGSPSPVALPASRYPWLPYVAVLLGYVVATIAFTWPLPTGLADHSIERGDTWQAMWNFWLLKHNLLDLHSWPLDTNLVYYPGGTSLYQHTFDLDMGLLFLPLTILLGPILSFNLASLFVCVATGFSMYLLARYLTGSHLAGFIAGFALTFSAWHIARLGGQMNLASLQWVPLYMLFVVRREGRWWVNVLGAGIALALTIMAGWYLALYLGVFTVLWMLDRWRDGALSRPARLTWLFRSVVGLGVAFLMTLPLLIGLISGASSGAFAVPPFVESVTWSADLLAYFLPTTYSTFFGSLLNALGVQFWGNIEWEKMIFPGWSILALAGYALWRRLAPSKVWLNLALVSALLSFGPALHAGGQLFSVFGISIPLPYLAFYLLPGVEVSRTPVRFALMVLIALGVLAAYGLADLLRRLELRQAARPSLRPAALLVGGLVVLITLEQMIVPVPFDPITVSPFYYTLAQNPDHFALLEVPVGALGDYQLWQTIHEKPIVGGYLSRSPIDPFIEGSPGVREFTYPGASSLLDEPAGQQGIAPEASAARALLQSVQIRYILLHKSMLPAAQMTSSAALAAAISGAPPVYEDDELQAYQVNGEPAPDQVILQLGRGWKQEQPQQASGPLAWADAGAEIIITAFSPQVVRLSLNGKTYGDPRKVTAMLNGEDLVSWDVTADSAQLALPAFSVPAGKTHITLISDTPATPLPKQSVFDKTHDAAIVEVTRVGLTVAP